MGTYVVCLCIHVSSVKPLNEFQLNVVQGSHLTDLIQIHISPM
jgi:hypothetical protein